MTQTWKDPLPAWTTVMTADMREDQQAFQVFKGGLMQLLAVGNCTIFQSQQLCTSSFTFIGRGVHTYQFAYGNLLWYFVAPPAPVALTLGSKLHRGSLKQEKTLDEQVLKYLYNNENALFVV